MKVLVRDKDPGERGLRQRNPNKRGVLRRELHVSDAALWGLG